jgi:hypothetical protein
MQKMAKEMQEMVSRSGITQLATADKEGVPNGVPINFMKIFDWDCCSNPEGRYGRLLLNSTTRYISNLLVTICFLIGAMPGFAYNYNSGVPAPGDTSLTLNSVNYGGSDSFSAVLRNGSSPVGVILIHGRGESLFDGHVILPLRLDLNMRGYTTLSIETPVPKPPPPLPDSANPYAYTNFQFDAGPAGANYVFPELYARVRAAADELKSHGNSKVVLISFSLGSRLGAAYLSHGSPGSLPVVGFAGIGMGGAAVASLLDTPTSIHGITVPLLDLYGSQDNSDVLARAADRRAAYTGPSYSQYIQGGSGHLWVGYEPQLISYVKDWITSVANSFTLFLPLILNHPI